MMLRPVMQAAGILFGHVRTMACVGLAGLLSLGALAQPAAPTGLLVGSLTLQGQAVKTLVDVALRAPGQPSAQRLPLAEGQTLAPGTEITLPRGAKAVLLSRNDNAMTLHPGASFIVGAVTDRGESHQPLAGKVDFEVRRALDFFNISYTRFTAAVKGTAYSVEISPADQTVEFRVSEGQVEVRQLVPLRVRTAHAGAALADDAPAEGPPAVPLIEDLAAGQQRTYSLNIDQYLKQFGTFAEASAYFQNALADAERSGSALRVHRALIVLMEASNVLGQPQATLGLVDHCLRAASGTASPTAAQSCHISQGNALQQLGRYVEAAAAHQWILDAERRRLDGRDSALAAAALNNLANAQRSLGDIDRALQTQAEGVRMRERMHGTADHLDLARSRSNLARLHRLRGDLRQALALYEGTLAMAQRVLRGANHPLVAYIQGGLGQTLGELGDLPRAATQHEQALAMARALYPGSDHPATAEYLSNLGFNKLRQGQRKESVALQLEALAMRQRLFGAIDHVAIADSLTNLGLAYNALGDKPAANSRLEEALAMRIRLFGARDHVDIAAALNNLGLAQTEAGRLDGALALHQRSLAMKRALYGNIDHPSIARSLGNSGNVQLRQRQATEAVASYQQALAMRQRLFGDRPNPDVAQSMAELARAQLAAGDLAGALALQEQALAMREALHAGQAHRDVVASLRAVADLSARAGRTDDAARLRARADAVQRQLPAP